MTTDEKNALEDYVEFHLNVLLRHLEPHVDLNFTQAMWDSADHMMDDLRITFAAQVEIGDTTLITTGHKKS